ncbi:hypothetical protein TWF696_007281 [Orbilia brochopaga]|uniref:Uncharacterized protein n=1 Tax=Orbilia brochopaga TaxID=3140254 RepID=A0AAV9UV12_9PEZI
MASTTSGKAFPRVEIYGEADRSHALDAIDKIRDLQIREVSVPQLVAVGNESCGKSSLLESITGISFPVGNELCTRIATQIVLRRTENTGERTMVYVTIVPGSKSALDDAEVQESFPYSCPESEFGPVKFKELIKKAERLMGINRGQRFSDAILKIELSGPHHPHLTIVDVPGLFHNETGSQTMEDASLVRRLIEDYVRDPRTIIIAVMDGSGSLSNQGVFGIVKAADPGGERTVGVITKCDRAQTGAEHTLLKMAANVKDPLHHGWFLVRNRTTDESNQRLPMEERQKREEEFFKKEPWNTVNAERVGVDKLKVFLGSLLYQQIQSELPKLTKEIDQIVTDCNNQLARLGKPRVGVEGQRIFLTSIATNYGKEVTNCLDGKVGGLVDKDSPLKIRTHIQKMHERFAEVMKNRGHTRAFEILTGDGPDDHDDPATDDNGGLKRDSGSSDQLNKNDDDASSVEDESKPGPDDDKDEGTLNVDTRRMFRQSQTPEPMTPKLSHIYDWIRETHDNSRGTELRGQTNPRIVVDLFQKQAENWPKLAKDHIDSVVDVVDKFDDHLFKRVAVEEAIRRRLQANIATERSERIRAAYHLFHELVKVELEGHLKTVDEDYRKELARAKALRVRARITGSTQSTPTRELLDIDDITKFFEGEQAVVEDIHDVLKAYYPIALKRFVAAINGQVVDEKLLGDEGPLGLFSPNYIAQLTEEQLKSITREDAKVASTRKELQLRLARAQKALKVAESI